ncbi:MAG: hypothetical protein SNJ60_06395 [Pseudanabaenaceae cyanobacterium]
MEPYRPSSHTPKRGLLPAFGLPLVTGGVTAVALSSLSPWLYLPGGFAALLGLATAAGAMLGVRWGKVRGPKAAFGVAAIAGLISYGVFHGTHFFRFRQAALAEIAQQLDPAEAHRKAEFLGEFLRENVGAAGFWGYLRLVNQEEVAGILPGRPPFRLFWPAWAVWTWEAIAVTVVAGLGGYSQAVGLFSAETQTWFGRPRTVGYTADSRVLELLTDPAYFPTLRQALGSERPAAATYWRVDLWQTPGAKPQAYCLEVVRRQTYPCQPGTWQTVFCAVLTPQEAAALID